MAKITKRSFLGATSAAMAAAALPTFVGVRHAGAQTTVSMQLGWLASNGILGEVAAMKNGFYEEEGISLDVVPGGPNVDGVGGVAAGRSTLGQISSSPSILLARSAGIPI